MLGAVLLVLLVGRSWGWQALSLPFRPLAAAFTGAVVAAVGGRVVSSRFLLNGVGRTLVESLALGLLVGMGAVVLMVGVALAVDPSLARRIRRIRSARGGSR
jgi:putative peptidoglycan lipid II flippase